MVSSRPGHVLGSIVACITALTSSSIVSAQSTPAEGRTLFFAERKGNCAACHKTPTDALSKGVSTIGPALESIKQKYAAPADRERLRNAIRDLSASTPNTVMPPYGKHRLLKETEIDAVVAYLETL